jgi:hypothetical protein
MMKSKIYPHFDIHYSSFDILRFTRLGRVRF